MASCRTAFGRFKRAVTAGVRIAMGTGSAVTPHGENLRELALMAEGGMRPEDVLVATMSSTAIRSTCSVSPTRSAGSGRDGSRVRGA